MWLYAQNFYVRMVTETGEFLQAWRPASLGYTDMNKKLYQTM